MGAFKQMEIEAMENHLPLTYDSGEESHFHMIVDGFIELIARYDYPLIINAIPPNIRFDLLQAIIKSNGNLIKE